MYLNIHLLHAELVTNRHIQNKTNPSYLQGCKNFLIYC